MPMLDLATRGRGIVVSGKILRAVATTLLVAVAGIDVGLADDRCKKVKKREIAPLTTSLSPGSYRFELVATKWAPAKRSVVGTMELRAASPEDVSPTTGERAQDSETFAVLMYGWIDFNPAEIGAPICGREKCVAPSPLSKDPVYPGVIVKQLGWSDADFVPRHPENAPTLMIATNSNLRNGEQWTDGWGIALWIQSDNGGVFRGRWEEWGIVRGSRGHFCISGGDAEPPN